MPAFLKKFIKPSLYLILAAFLAIPLSAAFAQDGGEDLPVAPPDPDISDVCTPAECSPATPCADPDEKCYSVEGAMYCCVMPPVPGAQAVGE